MQAAPGKSTYCASRYANELEIRSCSSACHEKPASTPFDVAFAAHLGDSLFEHVLIEFKTDFADVAVLLFTEKIAAAANVEIVAGQCETGTQ